MGYFIDYISFTLKVDTDLPGIAMAYFYKYVKLEIEEGEVCKGINGYKQSVVFPSGIRVLYDGMPGMGIHIVIPGLGLKSNHLDFDIFELIEKLKNDGMKYNISRVDVALDTDIDFGYFHNKFVRRQFVCSYRDKNIRQYVDLNNRGTLYFGKRGGLTMFRIYDKALEQKVEDKVWTRIELECRNEACEQIIEALRTNTINCYFLGHLRFVDKRCNDMSRAKTTKKYLELLNNPKERMKLKAKAGDNTLDWFVNQVAPTIKALRRDYGEEFVEKVIESSKISKRQFKKRFNLMVLDSKTTVNLNTGELFEPTKLTKEYIQQCIDDLDTIAN